MSVYPFARYVSRARWTASTATAGAFKLPKTVGSPIARERKRGVLYH